MDLGNRNSRQRPAWRRRFSGAIDQLLAGMGYQLVPRGRKVASGFEPEDIATFQKVSPFTMTSLERVAAVCQAVRYVGRHHIAGAVVECGVWRGGSMMAVAHTLLEGNVLDRDLFLFDTFEGMPAAGEHDVLFTGETVGDLLNMTSGVAERVRAYASLDDVRRNMAGVGYPEERIHFVQGKVEDRIPADAPPQIALLRLDTDWYESTRHELVHLFPRLAKGGVLIIDDYGDWQGARKAVDEYVAECSTPILLNRIDHTGRVAVKIS